MAEQKIELTVSEWEQLKLVLLWGGGSAFDGETRQQFRDVRKMLCDKIPGPIIDHNAPQPPKPAPEILPYQVIIRRKDGTSTQWQFFDLGSAKQHYETMCGEDVAICWLMEQTRITQIWQAKK